MKQKKSWGDHGDLAPRGELGPKAYRRATSLMCTGGAQSGPRAYGGNHVLECTGKATCHSAGGSQVLEHTREATP